MDFDALDRCAREPCGERGPEAGASNIGPEASEAGDSEIFATGQPAVFALARGPSTLYWTSEAPSGRVASCPLAACSTPTVLVSGGSPTAVVWSGHRLFWTDDDEADKSVGFTNDASGIGSVEMGQPSLWVTADTDAYVVQKNGTLVKLVYDPPTGRASFLSFSTFAERVSTRDGAVAWTERDGSVHVCASGDCATVAESVVAKDQGATAIALDDGLLFWATSDGRIRSVTYTSTSFGSDIGEVADRLPELSELAPDTTGSSLYFSARGTALAGYADGIVGKVPKGGGAVTVLAHGQARPEGIVVTETHVYWANHNDGTIRRAPK